MFGVLGLAALGILGGWMTEVLYGSEYQVVSGLLPFLGVVLLLRFLASSYVLLLTVADRQLVRTLIVHPDHGVLEPQLNGRAARDLEPRPRRVPARNDQGDQDREGGNRPEAGGMGWWTDYPGADNNFSVRLRELTFVRVKLQTDGQPDNVVVRLTDPILSHCPILFMEDVGTARFSDDEVQRLRAYLEKGGFLYVDAFWGSQAWDQWVYEIGRVLPPHKYPIFDIPPDHAIMHALYDVKAIPQVSSINFWSRSGGSTSERGPDSPHANFRGIQDEHGRLMVVMTHNTDISDTWEREGENQDYFDRFSPDGYAVGVNIILYAMTH